MVLIILIYLTLHLLYGYVSMINQLLNSISCVFDEINEVFYYVNLYSQVCSNEQLMESDCRICQSPGWG